MFKVTKSHSLRKLISACVMFDSIMDPTTDYQEISNRAKQALKAIGKESPINARRVKAYGVVADGGKS